MQVTPYFEYQTCITLLILVRLLVLMDTHCAPTVCWFGLFHSEEKEVSMTLPP
jgi:hypothetical protein